MSFRRVHKYVFLPSQALLSPQSFEDFYHIHLKFQIKTVPENKFYSSRPTAIMYSERSCVVNLLLLLRKLNPALIGEY